MKKPNIAIVTNASWNIYKFRINLIKHLIAKGFNITVICPNDGYLQQIGKETDKVIPLKKLSRKGTNPFADLALYNELKTIYKVEQIDLALHFTIKPNIYGALAAKSVKIPSISTVTGLGYAFASRGIANLVANQLYRQAFKNSALIAFQNKDDRNLFIQKKLVNKSNSIIIHGSGINTATFKPNNTKKANSIFNFLFIGRLLKDKGIFELLDAYEKIARQNPHTTLTVVGGIDKDNPNAIEQSSLDTYLAKTSSIFYLGHLDNPIHQLTEADAVVLPSYREGLPRVMLEAISMAKPIITTDVAGCREVVIDKVNGYAVPSKNAAALQKAMEKMLKQTPDKLKEMGKQGRALALKKFDTKLINETYVGHINRLLKFKI